MGTQLPPPSPLQKRGSTEAPRFRPVYYGQTAGWIKMPLRMEVGLDPGHIVLDGDLAALHFSAHVYCGQTVAHLSNC